MALLTRARETTEPTLGQAHAHMNDALSVRRLTGRKTRIGSDVIYNIDILSVVYHRPIGKLTPFIQATVDQIRSIV
jgi:hypothetical protein